MLLLLKSKQYSSNHWYFINQLDWDKNGWIMLEIFAFFFDPINFAFVHRVFQASIVFLLHIATIYLFYTLIVIPFASLFF